MIAATRTIPIAIVQLLFISTNLFGQVTNCPYLLDVNGDPIINTHFEAEKKVSSHDTIITPQSVTFSAPEVCLNTNFSVESGASFAVDTLGCIAECIPDFLPCEETCLSPLYDTTTMTGQRFVKYEVVLTFPDTTDVTFQGGVTVFVNGLPFNIREIMKSYMDQVVPGATDQDTLKACLCDENIFLYENENLIFEEGRVASSNSGEPITEEGGVFSLNYILENFEPLSPDTIAQNTSTTFMEKGNLMPSTGSKIVAILDSGLDPSMVPLNSLYFNGNPATFVCTYNDPAGWNFIDENENLYDDRGHGTLVTLSYLYALQNLKPLINIELSQILTVKVLNECGEGTTYSTICGLKYAKEKGARLVNTSWGMYEYSYVLQRAIQEVTKSGIKVISSSGNIGADLNQTPHFPSGYASSHQHFLKHDSLVTRPGFNNVYEVSGACRFIDANCTPQRINLPLETTANYRDTIFVEASRAIKKLLPLPLQPSCQIQGTSYASPQLAAGVFHSIILTGTATKSQMISSSKQIHPEFQYFSYYMNNCN